ncbi:MAG: hypothetical protein HYW51_03345 [Candidatus Doudnabacteria bacterium]|nr:hypothetical protein [Candidatus Doudnabacteria bacterium]
MLSIPSALLRLPIGFALTPSLGSGFVVDQPVEKLNALFQERPCFWSAVVGLYEPCGFVVWPVFREGRTGNFSACLLVAFFLNLAEEADPQRIKQAKGVLLVRNRTALNDLFSPLAKKDEEVVNLPAVSARLKA